MLRASGVIARSGGFPGCLWKGGELDRVSPVHSSRGQEEEAGNPGREAGPCVPWASSALVLPWLLFFPSLLVQAASDYFRFSSCWAA